MAELVVAAVVVVALAIIVGALRSGRKPVAPPPPPLANARFEPRRQQAPLPPLPSARPEPPRQQPPPAPGPATPVPPPLPHAALPVAAPKSALPATAWLPAGQRVVVAGIPLPGGLIYVGSDLGAMREWRGPEPALVDPRLPVDVRHPDHTGLGMTYWPSYSEISPACRAGYLLWLASGREASAAYIGYVFLFFYGLERRLLRDQVLTTGGPERTLIAGEIERLIGVYGHNASFRRYAGRLLGLVRAIESWGEAERLPAPTRAGETSEADAYVVRAALGQILRAGRPVPPDWALAWLLHSPDVRLRTPATRCPAEFAALFSARYRERFGAGLAIRANRTALKFTYEPASSSFGGPVDIRPTPPVPDITALRVPVEKLVELAEECQSALDPYSRWLGRNPDAKDATPGLALLPREVLAEARPAGLRALSEWVESRLAAGSPALVDAQELLAHWPHGEAARLTKGETVALGQLLDKLRVGFEPDVRFGGPALTADTPLVLFRLPDAETQVTPSGGYQAATVLLHLAVVVAAADGEAAPAEQRLVEEQLENALRLTAAERARLSAHLRWLIESEPGLAGMKRKLEPIGTVERRRIAEFVVAVAGADGRIDPAEVNALRKIYPLLGLAPDDVYGHINALASAGPALAPAPAREPVTVRAAEPRAAGRPIPPPPAPGLALDMKRVQQKLAETAAVSALLGSVFSEDEPGVAPAGRTVAPPQAVASLSGLDPAHSALLLRLATQASWPKAEIEALAAELGLLPDGAIETINDAAFEKAGTAVLEGDDPLELNRDVYQEIVA